jgi:hypothetical protein
MPCHVELVYGLLAYRAPLKGRIMLGVQFPRDPGEARYLKAGVLPWLGLYDYPLSPAQVSLLYKTVAQARMFSNIGASPRGSTPPGEDNTFPFLQPSVLKALLGPHSRRVFAVYPLTYVVTPSIDLLLLVVEKMQTSLYARS